MRLLYDLGIRIYYLLILAASLANSKARRWIRGRKGLMQSIAQKVDPGVPVTWFHCSSLGEFEQGRPVIEKMRKEVPGKKILLTFFSPSGYEIRKNYPGADYVFYMPLDTRRNARCFLELIRVEQAFFIKYEFWYHFLSALHEKKIPVCLVSGIFREKQVFFRWYGGWFRRMLGLFDHLFVQQESSLDLLASIGATRASVSGDTRFDRVYDISQGIVPDPRLKKFADRSPLIVAGSTWPADEEILARYINESGPICRWIIVPHEIHESGISRLEAMMRLKALRYTALQVDVPDGVQLIIVDTIGILSSLYQYARVAYIGGGFGKGIHNTLEAATFGKPVLFGPHYRKFQEAVDLVSRGAAFPVGNYPELKSALDRLLGDPKLLKTSGETAETYVKSRLGASSRIVDYALKRKTG